MATGEAEAGMGGEGEPCPAHWSKCSCNYTLKAAFPGEGWERQER